MDTAATRHRPGTYQRGEDTRHRLIEAALEIFATHGYEGATTRILAERAGVNLPAIQYYFGNKEGLYRAAIETIVARIDERFAEVSPRIEAALKRSDVPRAELLVLLQELLDAFVELIVDKERPESRRLFIARAEIENLEALDSFHESIQAQLVRPCAALIGRLLGRAADDPETNLRTIAILGQVNIFCHTGARRILGWSEIDEPRVRSVQALVREQTAAIFHRPAGSVRP